MGLRSSLRAHRVAVALLSVFLLLVVGAAVAVLYVGRDERRSARILAAFLSERLGHPVEIARAATDGTSYVILSGVRVPPAGAWTTDLAIREIRVDGPLPRALLGPRGQHFRIQVLSTSVTLAQAAEPPAPPTVAALEQLRGLMTRLLEWRATASFGLSGGELRVRGRPTHFDVDGEKSADGKVALRLTARSGTGAALIVDGAGSIVDRVLTLRLSAEGDPRALGGIWPEAVAAKHLTGVTVLSLPRATHLDLDGRVTLTPDGARPALSLSIRAAYLAGESRADVSRLTVEWGPSLRLSGSGSASGLNASPRVGLRLEGSAAGSPLEASLDLSAGDRRLAVEAHLSEARLRPLIEQMGLSDHAPPKLDGRVASAQVTTELLWAADGGVASGRARGRLERVVVEGGGLKLSAPAADVVTTLAPDGADRLRADSSITAQPLDASTGGQTHRVAARSEIRHLLPRSAPWHAPGSPERVALALSSPDGAAILQATATPASQDGSGERQFSIQALLPDLGRVPQLVQGMAYEATGSARLDGKLAWSPEGAPRFRGEVDVRAPRLAFPRFAAVVSDLAGKIPVWHGVEGSAPLGTVTVQSLTSYGVGVSRFSSPAQIQDGVLNLPAATYVHYGGAGKGWAQADLTDPNLPVRFRFEGAQVDLGRFFAETGLQAARVTGQARYVVGLIFSRQFGAEAAGEFHVDPPGGVISIDVLKRLILSAPESPLGIVRETLEELSEFRYKSLEGQLFMDQQETHVSLSLQGKERLGIFPPKIRAINIHNLPLSRAMKILGPHLRRESS